MTKLLALLYGKVSFTAFTALILRTLIKCVSQFLQGSRNKQSCMENAKQHKNRLGFGFIFPFFFSAVSFFHTANVDWCDGKAGSRSGWRSVQGQALHTCHTRVHAWLSWQLPCCRMHRKISQVWDSSTVQGHKAVTWQGWPPAQAAKALGEGMIQKRAADNDGFRLIGAIRACWCAQGPKARNEKKKKLQSLSEITYPFKI